MRFLDKENLGMHEDWYGTNAAVACFACGKVFLTSKLLHRKGRSCPNCKRCTVTFTAARVGVTEAGDEA